MTSLGYIGDIALNIIVHMHGERIRDIDIGVSVRDAIWTRDLEKGEWIEKWELPIHNEKLNQTLRKIWCERVENDNVK